jgi:uncharacterized protein with beta-barrel porin domain
LSSFTPGPVRAAGGAGGFGAPGAGGAGGTGFTSNPGGNGTICSGAGGGGAGGGAGGVGAPCVGTGGTAGAGGTSGSPNGGNGGDGSLSTGGGGGGGGGANGVDAAAITNASPVAGGDGGNGGRATDAGAGGGGAGGYGAVATGNGASSNNSTIKGGNGGTGGNRLGGGVGNGGNGGDGGVGIQFTTSGAVFTNTGTVTAGNGGAAGAPSGSAGVGGVGISGSGLTIINAGGITGGLANNGAGARANAITFTGGTNILELQAGSTITGNVVGTGTDTFRLGGSTNSSFDTSLIGAAAQYQGFGVFNKTGTSTWTLTGTAGQATPWIITGGTLVINGSIATSSLTTVNSAATLTGVGAVGATIVASNGTFAPGNGTPGSLMTVSSLNLASGAFYIVQINPTTSSFAHVTGTATLGGATVEASFASGSYVAKQYTILTAGSVSGNFGPLINTNLPSNFKPTLSTDPTHAYLNLVLNFTPPPGSDLNTNQQNVANAVVGFFNSNGSIPMEFGGLTPAGLTQLSGEAATGAQGASFQLGGEFLGLMLDPFVDGRGGSAGAGGPAMGFAPEREPLSEDIAMAYAKALKAPVYKAPPVAFEQGWTAWGTAFGGYNKTNGDPSVGSNDLTARTGGIAAGLDYHFSRDAVFGFALAGGGTNWGLANGLGGGKSDAFQAGVYGIGHSGPAYLGASLTFTDHWMTTDRFAALGDHVTASFNAQSIGARVESGYRAGTPVIGITPYAALQAQSFHTPTYSETDLTAGGFGLTYNTRTANDVRSELGAHFDHAALVNPNAVLMLRGRLAWAHDWVSDPSLAAVFQTLPGTNFIVSGATPAKDSALVSAGAELRLINGVTLLGKFDGEFARGSQTYAGTGTIRYTW